MKDRELMNLDKVLKYLNSQNQQWHNVPDIIQNIGFYPSEAEVYFILEKLVKDGYCISRGETTLTGNVWGQYAEHYTEKYYIINYDGIFFLKEGAYFGLLKKNSKQRKIQNIKDYALIIGTWLAGLGALALVGWEIIKTFYIEHK